LTASRYAFYQLYPDFNIDIAAEQAALARADRSSGASGMVQRAAAAKLWMDKVLAHGRATGTTLSRCAVNRWRLTTGSAKGFLLAWPGFDVWRSR
jgi:glutathione-regulated potassium-efflux system ancillary protein KefF